MQKQKKGFWLFIFSLIPGAGEMYMGFKKQGLSIMLLFLSIFAFGTSTGMNWVILFFPAVWFYSFFNVHNLKSLTEKEFSSVEDSYILHLEEFLGDADIFLSKYRKAAAVLMIVFGGSVLWNALADTLYWILPERMANMLRNFSFRLPQVIIAAAVISAGIYLLSDRRIKLSSSAEKENGEHPSQPHAETNDTISVLPVEAAPAADVSPVETEQDTPAETQHEN